MNTAPMPWRWSNRCDPLPRALADRHYNRQSVGAKNFVPPGRCLVLYASSDKGEAFWVTSWPFAEYVKHEWAGAWICSAFRNEGFGKASDLILAAVSATVAVFGPPPELGMVTFIDRKKVKPTVVRGVETWGWTYQKAGFEVCGETKVNRHLALRLDPSRMPPPALPLTEMEAAAGTIGFRGASRSTPRCQGGLQAKIQKADAAVQECLL